MVASDSQRWGERCSIIGRIEPTALALHALAVMTSILEAATEGRKVKIRESCERPPALAAAETRDLLRARG
jgi:hypothetical protein